MSTPVRLEAGSEIRLSDGRRLKLGKLLKSGGAGSVYLVPGATDLVAKVYHDSMDLPVYERKVSAMLEHAPNLPDLHDPSGDRIVQIAWPRALIRDTRGQFRGFVMPKLDIDATIELEYMLQERQARAEGLPTGLGARLTLATNLSALLAALHGEHYFVVDLKPLNVRFYRKTLYLAMLDCDGFSVQTPQERFAALQFTAEYFAPELQAGGLAGHRNARTAEELQDRFALAVVAFQLLNFGIHPYSGQPADDRVPTDLPGRIAGNFYAYGLRAHARVRPNPVSGHALMPQTLRVLFDRAFGTDPAQRPSAAEWQQALSPYALRDGAQLVTCAADAQHQHFAGLACAACARAKQLSQAVVQAKTTKKRTQHTGKARRARTATAPATPRGRGRRNTTHSPGTSPFPTAQVPPPSPTATQQQPSFMGGLFWHYALFFLIPIVLGWCSTRSVEPRAPVPSTADSDSSSVRQATTQSWNARSEEQLSAVLKAIVSQDAAAYASHLTQLSTLAATPPRVSSTRMREAAEAIKPERAADQVLRQRQQTPAQAQAEFEARLARLKTAYQANPYLPGLAEELASLKMTDWRRRRVGDAEADARTLAEEVLPTLRRAITLQPSLPVHWNALALACVYVNHLPCAEGAYAVGLLLMAEPPEGRRQLAQVYAELRGSMLERGLSAEERSRSDAAKAKAVEHALKIGPPEFAELLSSPRGEAAKADDLPPAYAEGTGLIPLCVDAHYQACGLLDRQGAWRVPPRYREISENAGGWTVKTTAGGTGLLDHEGRVLIEPLLYSLGPVANGLMAAQTGRRALYGYVDTRGNWVIPPQFMYPASFNRNAALVWVPGAQFKDRRLALVNAEGKLTFLRYTDADHNESASPWSDGRFVVHQGPDSARASAVIDDAGRVVVPAERVSISLAPNANWIAYANASGQARDSSQVSLHSRVGRTLFQTSGKDAWIRQPGANGFAVFTDANGREGLLNLRNGQISIPPSSRELGLLMDDRISYRETRDGKTLHGFLDLQGRVLIPPKFEDLPLFDRGLAPSCQRRPDLLDGRRLGSSEQQVCSVIDSAGREMEAFTHFNAVNISRKVWKGHSDDVIRDVVRIQRLRTTPPPEPRRADSGSSPAEGTVVLEEPKSADEEVVLTTLRGDVLARVQTDPACGRERVVNARGQVIWPLEDGVLCELRNVHGGLPANASPALAKAFREREAFKASEDRDRIRMHLRSFVHPQTLASAPAAGASASAVGLPRSVATNSGHAPP